MGWDPNIKKHYLKAYPEKYKKFISKANDNRIEVEALLGNPDWTLSQNFSLLKNEVNVVLDYNRKNPNERFETLHLDIEPHGLVKQWKVNKEGLLQEYLLNLKKVRNIVDSHNLTNKDSIKISVDVPYWLHQHNLNGEPVLDLLMPLIDIVAIMKYTKYPDNYYNSAIIFLKKAEEYNKKVTVGSEFQPEYQNVNLNNFKRTELRNYFKKPMNDFVKYNSFDGFSIHGIKSYQKYLDENINEKE